MGQEASTAAVGGAAGVVVCGALILATGGIGTPAAAGYLLTTAATGWGGAAAAGGYCAAAGAVGAGVALFAGRCETPEASHSPTNDVTCAINQNIYEVNNLNLQTGGSNVKELEAKVEALEKQTEELLKQKGQIQKEWPLPDGLDPMNINIAIMGPSGVGKSSLLNRICDRDEDDEDGAKVGINECTKEIKTYDFKVPVQGGHILGKLWDIPGGGTDTFPAAEYIQQMGLRYYDVLLILTAGRWTEVDTELLKGVRDHKIPACIARMKMDDVIMAGERKKKTPRTPKESMNEARMFLEEQVGVEQRDHVFLVTAFPEKYPEFLDAEYNRMMKKIGEECAKVRANLFDHIQS